MKRTLVTGGTGFVGANLVRRLLNDGHEVHLLVRQGYNPWRIESIRDSVQLHEVDLTDKASLIDMVQTVRPDWVFHLAAYGAYSSQTDLDQMVQTNVIGTLNLVEACLQVGIESFINAGSSSEYGFKDHAPAEDASVDPNSSYSVTKLTASQFCRYRSQASGTPLTTLRLYSVYGAFEEPTRLLPTLIVKGLAGELPPLVNPTIARDYVYIEDVSDAFLQVAQAEEPELGAIYNVGSGVQTSLSDVVEVARDLLHIEAEPQWGSMPDRRWDTSIWVADHRRISAALGWQPKFAFRAGFQAMIDWLATTPSMRDFYKTHRLLPV